MTDKPIPPGLTPERAGFFTDAVFAIAMTLLVIEIPRPEGTEEFDVSDGLDKAGAAGNLLHFLGGEIGSFVAYLLAFQILWGLWRQHHELIDQIRLLSPAMIGWHYPFLLLVGFLPFPTTVYGNHTSNPVAALLFTCTVGALMVCRTAMRARVLKDDLLLKEIPAATVRARQRTGWIISWYWLATAVLAWWTPWIIIAWTVSPFLSGFLHRREGRASVAAADAPPPSAADRG